ncbi:MAG: tetratricopeptide repeat protein [Niastella sp.]|nr:tetratricopeptide repeat protein [Niastella sp.]
MKGVFLLLLGLCIGATLTAQMPLEDSLKRGLAQATNDQDRIINMAGLSIYYMGINSKLSDSFANKMLEIAEVSRDRKLMIKAYVNNARRYFDYAGTKETMAKGLDFSDRAIELAKSSGLDDYAAIAYANQSRAYRNTGEMDKAFNAANLAVAMATNSGSDSAKAVSYMALGSVYLVKNEKLLAFRNYLQALDIAEESKDYSLLRNAYSNLSTFYNALSDYEKAKDFEFKKIDLQRANNRKYDLVETYNSIGHLYRNNKQYDLAEKYYENAIALADSIHFGVYKLNSYLNIVNLHLTSNQYQKGLDYFQSHQELKEYILRNGMDFILYQGYGTMYTFLDKLDSAGYYFKLAEPGFETRATKLNKYLFYSSYGFYFRKRSDYDHAIAYWQKAKQVGDEVGSIDLQQQAVRSLDSLYQWKGDFKTAHVYTNLYYEYKDSLQKLAKEKDLLSLEIDDENKRKEREAKQKEVELTRKHNIQYLGMVVAIAVIFLLLVMAGIFRVSKTTIKVLGFFAFIFLFEFIILLADHKIHDLTHGEPWKVMLIKIILIAMLLPLHHWLEEKVIHYLTSQHLLLVKGRNLYDKVFRRKKGHGSLENV